MVDLPLSYKGFPRLTPHHVRSPGITEVCTDDSGAHHGTGYGASLVSMTERRNKTGKARGKLWALSKKDAGSKRARHIARHNLGTKKQAARLERSKAQLKTIAGAAVKEVVYGQGNRTRKLGRAPRSPTQRPSSIIIEDLSHLRGKAKSKKVSRMCAAWARSENEERITVHAYVGGSDVKTVNAAYTSQTCPEPTCVSLRTTGTGTRFTAAIPIGTAHGRAMQTMWLP